jgi:hypothetical protein
LINIPFVYVGDGTDTTAQRDASHQLDLWHPIRSERRTICIGAMTSEWNESCLAMLLHDEVLQSYISSDDFAPGCYADFRDIGDRPLL